MKLPRIQFGLRIFIVAVFVSAFLVVFIWEKANQPQVFRSTCNILGAVTYGDVAELEELTLSPAMAMRSVSRCHVSNAEMQEHIPSDVVWKSVEIEPLEEATLDEPRQIFRIGLAALRKRDFRCKLEGVDSEGEEVNAIVIVNRNHFHVVE